LFAFPLIVLLIVKTMCPTIQCSFFEKINLFKCFQNYCHSLEVARYSTMFDLYFIFTLLYKSVIRVTCSSVYH
jgi:hypothetical protein